jgi:hypothetical protein
MEALFGDLWKSPGLPVAICRRLLWIENLKVVSTIFGKRAPKRPKILHKSETLKVTVTIFFANLPKTAKNATPKIHHPTLAI